MKAAEATYMVRLAVLVASVAALVGCGTLSNTAESPAFHGHASGKAAVLTVECDRGAPASLATISGDKMKAVLGARHVEAVAPTDAAQFCSTYGRGMGGVDGFEVPANIASSIRETAKASGTETVLVNVIAYNRGCSDSEPSCTSRIDGATVRDLLFSADGAMLWKKWDFAPESSDGAESALARVFADVPADKLVTASTPAPAAPVAVAKVETKASPIIAAAITAEREAEPVAETPATPAPATPIKQVSKTPAKRAGKATKKVATH